MGRLTWNESGVYRHPGFEWIYWFQASAIFSNTNGFANYCVLTLVTTSWINDGASSHGSLRLLLFMLCTHSHGSGSYITMMSFQFPLLFRDLYARTLTNVNNEFVIIRMYLRLSHHINSEKGFYHRGILRVFHSVMTSVFAQRSMYLLSVVPPICNCMQESIMLILWVCFLITSGKVFKYAPWHKEKNSTFHFT